MFNLNEEFLELLSRYGIEIKEDGDEKLCKLYVNTFMELWYKIPDDEPIAVFGFGDAYRYLCPYLENWDSKNVVCIIENGTISRKSNTDIPVIKSKDIPKYSFQKIILTGFNSRDEVKRSIHVLKPEAIIVDVYDILEQRGIKYNKPFFEIPSPYFGLYDERIEYEQAKSTVQKQESLRCLISSYLKIHDFVYAKKFIEEYINLKFDGYEDYSKFLYELNALFAKTKEVIRQKKSKNIVLFMLDSLSHKSAENMPFILEQRKDSLVFSKAFTPYPYTAGSFKTFMTGKYYYLDKEADEICKTRALFLKPFKEAGFKFKHVACNFIHIFDKVNDFSGASSKCQPDIYWGFLNDYVQDDAPSFYLLHSFEETHSHYYHGYSSNKLFRYDEYHIDKFFKKPNAQYDLTIRDERKKAFHAEEKQHYESLQYADNQLRFYCDFLKPSDLSVIMGDHGPLLDHEWYAGLYWEGTENVLIHDNRLNILLQIKSDSIPRKIFDGLFCNIDLLEMLYNLLNKNFKIEAFARKNFLFIMDPTYNKEALEIYKKLPDYDTRSEYKGYLGIHTENEKYIKFMDGKEKYYLLPNEDDNLVNEQEYTDRVNYLRSLTESHWNKLKDINAKAQIEEE